MNLTQFLDFYLEQTLSKGVCRGWEVLSRESCRFNGEVKFWDVACDYNNQTMIYFYNNWELTMNWEYAFQELNFKYQQLSTDYGRAIQLRDQILSKIENLEKQNQEIRSKNKNHAFQPRPPPSEALQDSFEANLPEITIKGTQKMHSRIKKQSSAETETRTDQRTYQCTYDGCKRIYTSPVSMNLHIKQKHNGGTKKEREAYAKIVLEAQVRGEEPPQMDINLPPNFLQEFRTSYEYSKKYSM